MISTVVNADSLEADETGFGTRHEGPWQASPCGEWCDPIVIVGPSRPVPEDNEVEWEYDVWDD